MGGSGHGVRRRAATKAFLDNWHNPDLRNAQLAFGAAWAAEWAFTVGIGVYAYAHGGAAAVGIVSVLRMAPAAVVTPLVTPYADRWRRERVLVLVSALRVVAAVGTVGVVSVGGAAPLVYALSVAAAAATVPYRPVHSALLPSLCRTPSELAGANVVRGMLDSAAVLVGPAVAALLLHMSGVTAVFTAVAVASTMAALLMVRVHVEVVRSPSAPPRVRPLLDVADGLRVVQQSGRLRLLIGLAGLQAFTRGTVSVFTVVVAIDLLGTGDAGVGTLNAAIGAGAVVGSLVASLLVGTQRLARWFGVGIALWALPLAVLAGWNSMASAALLFAVIGLGNALVDVGIFTLIARLASDTVLARVFGALEGVIALAVGAGALATPAVLDTVGIRGALATIGVLSPAVVVVAWRRLRALDVEVAGQDRTLRFLRSVPMFAPLPLPAIERVARALELLDVPAGTVVFRQGEPADRYYVIENGTVDVVGDGQSVSTLGPGEGFGEIALLRHVPRTATVSAKTDVRLHSLTSHDFTAIVTGFRPSAGEAAAQVESLLRRFTPRTSPENGIDLAVEPARARRPRAR